MAEKAAFRKISTLPFEEALSELQSIVGTLERGETRLEEAINAFERGVALQAHCQSKLDAAKERIEQITGQNDDGSVTTKPFDA